MRNEVLLLVRANYLNHKPSDLILKPFLQKYYETTLPAIIFFQILYGIGLACALLPAYNEMVLTARDNDFDDSIKLFGLVSAVFNASYSAGEGLGPIFGGIIIDQTSFGVSF